jgi:hypothetical protein
MAFDLVFYDQEGIRAMSSPTMRRNPDRMITPGKGTEPPFRRAPRGAQQVTVPFPDAWADAWDNYKYAELAVPGLARSPGKAGSS